MLENAQPHARYLSGLGTLHPCFAQGLSEWVPVTFNQKNWFHLWHHGNSQTTTAGDSGESVL